MPQKAIGILTAGGDCPGLNAAIRAIAKCAIHVFGWKVIGFLDGYDGLIRDRSRPLSFDDVSNILTLGGTILGTSNKASPFEYYENGKGPKDVSGQAIANLEKHNINALFCIGGDGTLTNACRLHEKWPYVIGVPKTIDNDLKATEQTFGFDTACAFVTEAIDRIHSTAESHHRTMVIEVMGRYAGWIALEGGLAGGGDVILIPEMPFSFDCVASVVTARAKKGKRSSIVVVAEGAHPIGEGETVKEYVKDSPDNIRLGGIGVKVADQLEKMTGLESRVTVLGHLQRGGSPTFFDRVLATRYGIAAARFANEGVFGKMVALKDSEIAAVSLAEATAGLKTVSPEHSLVLAAKALGTSFGV